MNYADVKIHDFPSVFPARIESVKVGKFAIKHPETDDIIWIEEKDIVKKYIGFERVVD